jgi:NDP-sugar pyrophosphorylase family protein
MLPLVNRPMMEHIVDLLKVRHGIDDIVVTVAFMANNRSATTSATAPSSA